MHGIEVEGLSFLEAVLTGMTVCSVYTCLRVLRRIVRHAPAAIAAEDLFSGWRQRFICLCKFTILPVVASGGILY